MDGRGEGGRGKGRYKRVRGSVEDGQTKHLSYLHYNLNRYDD
jgi:hypothetical protein